MNKTGSCLCGAVTIAIENAPSETGACHCSMCRKWSGGVYLGYHAPAESVTIEGQDNISVYSSSEWAERGFCKSCGSSLFYRVTAPGPHKGAYHIGFGLLDDTSGVALTEEIFVDERPVAYHFAQETKKMTGPEVFAMFASPE